MDSSIRQAVIQGNFRIPYEELTQDDWLAILKRIASESQPVFKYLGTRPINDLLNITSGPFHQYTPPDLVKNPPLSLSNRCMELWDTIETYGLVGGNRGKDIETLLLVEGGRFVLWTARYAVESAEHAGCLYDVLSTAVYSGFKILGDQDFGSFLSPKVGRGILQKVLTNWGSIIKTRESRLDHLKRGLASLEEVVDCFAG